MRVDGLKPGGAKKRPFVAQDIIAAIVLATWLYLIAARGGFWRAADRDDDGARPVVAAAVPQWPQVPRVWPAPDEAQTVGETIASLLRQDYRGPFHVILVDDQSRDGTARVAREAASALGAGDRLNVISGRPLPAGWTGKLWAQNQGVEDAVEFGGNAPKLADYLLLTDADIVFEPGALSALVARAEQEELVLNSLMVKLRCKSFVERMFVPAFVFFFQM